MKQTVCLFIVILSINVHAQGALSGSYEDDQVVQLVQSHARAGIVWLGSGKKTFLSLYQEPANSVSSQAAIVLHSMGMHADWPEVIAPIRTQLPEHGWTSLSVQLPLLEPTLGHAEYGGTFKQANERIRTAILYLQDRGYTDIVIIAYSFGATTAVNYLAEFNSVIKALVGISMQPHPFLKPKFDIFDELSTLNLPILDIYADKDISGVLKSTDDRRLAAKKAGNGIYKQVVIRAANHYFSGKETDLMREIVAWLNVTVPHAEID